MMYELRLSQKVGVKCSPRTGGPLKADNLSVTLLPTFNTQEPH